MSNCHPWDVTVNRFNCTHGILLIIFPTPSHPMRRVTGENTCWRQQQKHYAVRPHQSVTVVDFYPGVWLSRQFLITQHQNTTKLPPVCGTRQLQKRNNTICVAPPLPAPHQVHLSCLWLFHIPTTNTPHYKPQGYISKCFPLECLLTKSNSWILQLSLFQPYI